MQALVSEQVMEKFDLLICVTSCFSELAQDAVCNSLAAVVRAGRTKFRLERTSFS